MNTNPKKAEIINRAYDIYKKPHLNKTVFSTCDIDQILSLENFQATHMKLIEYDASTMDTSNYNYNFKCTLTNKYLGLTIQISIPANINIDNDETHTVRLLNTSIHSYNNDNSSLIIEPIFEAFVKDILEIDFDVKGKIIASLSTLENHLSASPKFTELAYAYT